MLYRLKAAAKRSTLFGAAAALAMASFAPLAPAVYADALNPLTDRSLTLSSSAPGWDYKDGSGNTTYAQPNSGANGQKTGNTFAFKVSTDSSVDADADSSPDNPIKAMTFQYCTESAGDCIAPGDDAVKGTDTATTSDLNVVTSSPAEVGSSDFGTVVDSTTGAVKAVPGFTDPAGDTTGQYAAHGVAGNFVVYYKDGSTWTQSTGWTMTASTEVVASSPTPAKNYITLKNSTGEGFTAGQQVKVVFFGTNTNYITNPGSGAFFVKINTYSDEAATTVVDGGVTVANVMNRSIKIQTKVLETMQFSVGTVDPNTLLSTDGDATPGSEAPSTLEKGKYKTADLAGLKGETIHGVCDPILGNMTPQDATNVLKLGKQNAESSLSVDNTYSTHSYWRLSSNSSAGATVYYSGVTLSNTVGDKITPIGPTKKLPAKGSEQFGLAIANGSPSADPYATDYTQDGSYENGNDNGLTLDPAYTTLVSDAITAADGAYTSWHTPQLAPLVPAANYANGSGAINGTPTAQFAFDETSSSIPVALATESTEVVDCVTAKMRYVANIAATTPAGIYTTAVNYIAAPQY